MTTKTNIEHLRELLADNEEALEFAEALHEELVDKKDDLMLANDEIAALTTDKIELEDQMKDYHKVDLGLDVLHYRLEKGNLKIRQRLENFCRNANAIPNAEILF